MLKITRIFVIGCLLAGASLVFLNFRLADRNRELLSRVEAFYRSIELPVGARVPAVVGMDRHGGEIFVDPVAEELPVLLLVFSPFCPACDDNWPKWQPLLAAQRALGGKVVTVDISGAVRDDYLIAHGIDSIPVIIDVTPETNMAYRFRFTPQTLILQEGRLVAGWTGVLTEDDVSRAVGFLGGTSVEAPLRSTVLPHILQHVMD